MTKSMNTENSESGQSEKKINIMKAAQKRFVKHGVHKTTLDEIARDLRIGKSSLYHYFKSKEELFIETLTWETGNYLHDIADIFNDNGYPPSERFRNYLILKYYLKKNYRLIFNLLVVDLQGNSTQQEADLIMQIVKDETKLLSDFIQLASPESKEAEDMNTSYFLSLQSFMMIFIHQLFLKKMEPYSTEITENLMKSFEKMIAIDDSLTGSGKK